VTLSINWLKERANQRNKEGKDRKRERNKQTKTARKKEGERKINE
jgi:hypothetical protein